MTRADRGQTAARRQVFSAEANLLFLVKILVRLRGVTPGTLPAFLVWKGHTEASGSDYEEYPREYVLHQNSNKELTLYTGKVDKASLYRGK